MILKVFLIFLVGTTAVFAKPQLLERLPVQYDVDPLREYFNYIRLKSEEDEYPGLRDKHASMKGNIVDLPHDEITSNISESEEDAPKFESSPVSVDHSSDTSHDPFYPIGQNFLPSVHQPEVSSNQNVEPWQQQKRLTRPSRRRGPVMHRWQSIWGSPGKRSSNGMTQLGKHSIVASEQKLTSKWTP